MKKEILKLDKVSYKYKNSNYVLKDISYSFDTGKMYAIKGKSGSGKTTLLSLISGLETGYEGNITYNDEKLKNIDLDKYRSNNVGIVFQSYNLLPHLTAAENIILSIDISGLKLENKKKRVIELMKSVGLSDSLADRKILTLSGGEQQRIAIARSLSYNPDVILADEPTGNLDKETEDEILKIFSDLAHKKNKCVIIVTHSKNVCDSADKIYEIKK